ncbi:unnamed protein product [Rotaria socialis]|uniref:Uncharacterized protein n=1 Tax=Rotaria socialis TaxID=392032 RepID=A0A820BJ93_9BILA|nr:unnamed protein product [Rotaria socialis]CAF4346723.1 unnamed protein product [Rotaria socialis]CAF4464373.1 unnamed protein product [Rotaria socialis]CAF4479893.1 unnamed protein product [Rotaria socialis]CAF4562633.1 unnamed protein product [Rotaria socialis]
MASASGITNPSKKRNTFFSNFLSSKSLSIFRNKTSAASNNAKTTSKESQHYKSQINVNSQETPVPMCIGRGWLRKHVKRPISLDLDLVKTIAQQPSINNNEQLHKEEHQQSLNNMGTIMDRLLRKNLNHYHLITTSLCDDIKQFYRTGAMLASPQE